MVPRNWRTIVGYLSIEQIIFAPQVVEFLKDTFDITIELELSEKK